MIAVVVNPHLRIMAQGFAPARSQQKAAPKVLEASALSKKLQDCFSSIPDPRVERTRLHQLSDILIIAILTILSGGEGWEDMQLYGESKQEWLTTFLALPNGIPCADTFRRVFERINAKEFERCFFAWVNQLVSNLNIELVAIDGKKLRGSYDRERGKKALHLVSAWSSEHRLVLTQTKVQDKSNEITAIPAILELLDLSGCLITMDAMGTQKAIVKQIKAAGADYIVSLKKNHPKMYSVVENWFTESRKKDTLPVPKEQRFESGHHRVENRKVWVIPVEEFGNLLDYKAWTGLTSIVIVERNRGLWNKATHEIQFYLCSLEAESGKIGTAIRQHWGIENCQHWVLDVTFGEDACRVRSGHAPENLAVMRRFALNALRQEPSKQSLRQKSRRAGLDNQYMLKLLAAALPNDPDHGADPRVQGV